MIFLMVIISYHNTICGQTVIIRDSLFGTPISNVNITFNKTGVVSDKNGVVDISPFNKKDIVLISHISYASKMITKKNITDNIYLSLKKNVLPVVSLTANLKVPLTKKYKLFTIKANKIGPQKMTLSRMLSSKSPVVIQESQPGGGSPNYRGMEANRLLLIVDDIALNNAIYRSGHVQSSSSINPFFIQSISLLSGPASVGYGNGAMGGALILNTKNPIYKKSIVVHQQFQSSSNAKTLNIQTNYYKKKIAHITALSIKSVGNLKMGKVRKHGYYGWGNEKNVTNQSEQLYTNYNQFDLIHKSRYNINKKSRFLTNTQYSISSKINRFGKINDNNGGVPKYKNWYYGPQIRFFQGFIYSYKSDKIVYDNMKVCLAHQDVLESRHTQKYDEKLLNNRKENVKIYDINFDLNKKFNKIKLVYGAGSRWQLVNSTANLSNSQATFYNTSRYPKGGSKIEDVFIYTQANLKVNKKIEALIGIRWNKSKLIARFNDNTFSNIENNNESIVKSILILFGPVRNITMNLSYYGGFRNPNIDDIGKFFSKDDINVVVPNINLEPEYANNFEATFNYWFSPIKIQIQLFNTSINNAINREYGSINGSDSIYYDGKMMRVQMNKNITKATINGISVFADLDITKNILATASCNYLKGYTTDNKPLAHIPPFNAKISIKYRFNKSIIDFYTDYNSWKRRKDYDEAGVDNFSEATTEGNPSWYTLNIEYSKIVDSNISFTCSAINILDHHYKSFGSAISSSGRNFILGVRANF